VACSAEGFITGNANVCHGYHGCLQEFAWVELGWVLGQEAAYCTGAGKAQVGVYVYFAHTVFNALYNFLNRYAVGFWYLAAEFVDDFQPLLGYGAGAVHNQVGVWYAGVDGFDLINGQYVACRRAGELVRAVAGADGDGQGVYVGFL